MGIRIITDSGSDIKQETAKDWGIRVLPMPVWFGKEEYLDDVTLTADELYMRMVDTGELPRTKAVAVSDYEKAFADAEEAGDAVICIAMSSGMSACYRNACAAAEKYGEKVAVIDSLNVCASQHALVRYALGMVGTGKTFDEVVHRLERDKKRLHVISLVDTLDYVYMGGRLSFFSRFTGNLLRLKPIITADEDGKVRIITKAQGQKNGFRMFSELVEEAGGIDFSMPVCMHYSGLSDGNMRDFMKQEAALFEGQENHVHVMQFGTTVGTYSGPGAFAIGFFHRRIASFM